MNRIAFDLLSLGATPVQPDVGNSFLLGIRVDDRDFLDYVRDTERPFAEAEGHPALAGKYKALPAEIVLADLAKVDSKVSLYDCECGCPGCWPLRVRVSVSEQIIIWSDFEQPHRGPTSRASWWHYDKFGPFEFDRKQYVEALERADGELRNQQPA